MKGKHHTKEEQQELGLAIPEKKTLAVAEDVSLFAADAGAGQEAMTSSDYSIPRLRILQDLSPQVKKTEAGYIKGSEAGMICDPISEQLWPGDTGVCVIPISYRRSHIEWKLREKGGGMVKDWGADGSILDQTQRDDRGRMVLPSGNQITINAEYFVFVVDQESGSATPYVLGMSGTQLRKARRWNTLINQLRIPDGKGSTINPAMFYRSYQLTTVPERNDQGSWFGWHVAAGKAAVELPGGREIYLQAREFRKQIADGRVQAQKASHDEAQAVASAESDEDPM